MKPVAITLAAIVLLSASTASAMSHQQAPAGTSYRSAALDPDEHLEQLAAASSRADVHHGRPTRSVRNILRADPNLRAAFAWMDNR